MIVLPIHNCMCQAKRIVKVHFNPTYTPPPYVHRMCSIDLHSQLMVLQNVNVAWLVVRIALPYICVPDEVTDSIEVSTLKNIECTYCTTNEM